MSNSLLPILESVQTYPAFRPAFISFLSTVNLAFILKPDAVRPPPAAANATQAVKDRQDTAISVFDKDDERVCGYLGLSLAKVPLLRDKLLEVEAVINNPFSGLVLWSALDKEILDNPNRQIYHAVLDDIRLFRAGSKPIPQALFELNNKYAMLPKTMQPSVSAKCLQLRSALPTHYADIVRNISSTQPNASYASVCETVLSEFDNQRVLELNKVLESESANIATAPASLVTNATSVMSSDSVLLAAESSASHRRSHRDRSRSRERSNSKERYSGRYNSNHRSRSRSPYYGRRRSPSVRFVAGRRRGDHRHSSNFSRARSPSTDGYSSDSVQCHRCRGWGHIEVECGTKSPSRKS